MTIITEKNKSGDSSLHDWFNKSKSSDGKKGWVQLGGKYAGKPCAKQPGQKTKPKCGSSKMKRNLNKDEEAAAFRRKNKKDPNPNRKGKAINVSTEETIDQLFRKTLEEKKAQKCWPGYEKKGTKKMFGKTYNNCVKKEEVEIVDEGHENCGCGKNPCETYGMKEGKENKAKLKKTAKELDAAVAMHTKQAKRLRGMVDEGKFTHWMGEGNKAKPDYIDIDGDGDTEESMKKAVKDKKKGKTKDKEEIEEGKGEKDACYHKVKSRYSVWPSAYASGALVKCRKVGAANWGNKTKKESYSWRDDFDYQYIDEDWQKVNKKDKTDGMSQKAVNAYKRENPGSKLKTAVTGKVKKGSKSAKRRKSYCSRSKGQMKMHNINCKKTPDKAICKARKRWKC